MKAKNSPIIKSDCFFNALQNQEYLMFLIKFKNSENFKYCGFKSTIMLPLILLKFIA